MGKNREKKNCVESEHSPSTVFVSNLPYAFTNSQLEETFSDVGPVRRCFMVTQKGSTQHRGFAFVQFAVTEDAKRAIELKNGSFVGGRKIRIKEAMHRAPLEQRRPKTSQVVPQDDDTNYENDQPHKPEETLDMPQIVVRSDDAKIKTEKIKSYKPKDTQYMPKIENPEKPLNVKNKDTIGKDHADNKEGSEKQRVARTVIYGGLLNDDIAEDIHRRAKEIGTVSSVTYPLPKDELEHNGLAQEGCKMSASAVVFTSVRAARASVAMLHQKEIRGAKIWARQLGGEGAKTQKWKLIVRNLPFKAKANEIRDLFSSTGLVWDVYIPPNSNTGLSKGFAFVKFTCKQDAESAIKKFNGQMFLKRTIAVDWAVSKKIYTSIANSAVASEDGQESDIDAENHSSDGENHSCDDDMDEDVADTVKSGEGPKTVNNAPDESGAKDIEVTPSEVDFDEEAGIARKVLQNLISSTAEGSLNNYSKVPNKKKMAICDFTVDAPNKLSVEPSNFTKSKITNLKPTEGEEDLRKKIFISNLPFEVDNEEVKQRFAGFGEVLTFNPVLHEVTKRPKGTGFLKFKSVDAADAAVAAANVNSDLGIFLRGRQLIVFKAMDKKSAHEKKLEKAKPVDLDHRNLYLAKEGLIPEGSPAAEGVSTTDMAKRQSLKRKKETKLQSPNFHVSKTRLIMYNLPKTMQEKELRKLCVDAVTSRASKQKPVIRQIKVLKEDTEKRKAAAKDHSRGVAFIEFTEHQHALVALRTLNNNPDIFTLEHRPIVEFALDNVQKMKLRREKLHSPHQTTFNVHVQQNIFGTPNDHPNKNESLRKRKTEESSIPNGIGAAENEAATKNIRPFKNKKSKNQFIPKDILDTQQKSPQNRKTDNKPNDEKTFAVLRKRKMQDRSEQQNVDKSSMQGKKSKRNSQAGQAVVDKLDVLIEQYTNKFSRPASKKKGDNKQGFKQLRKWYEA